jgi:hypothetical protein
MRTVLLVFLLALLLPGIVLAVKPGKILSTVADDGTMNPSTQIPIALPPPTITDSPGTIIGETSYEYQTNGSTGNRIVVDQFGGIHVSWTRGMEEASRPRYVYYNFRDEITGWQSQMEVLDTSGTGFTTLDVMGGGEAVVAYHLSDSDPSSHNSVSVDAVRGFGIFTEHYLDVGAGYIWPYLSRDTNGRLHVTATVNESHPMRTGYTYSVDDGATWSRWEEINAIAGLSLIIISSPVSAKSAIIYAEYPDPEAVWYDVFVIESEDGVVWDFNAASNVTQYTRDDSVTSWPDVEGLYDHNDDLHVAYLEMDNYAEEEIGDLMHWSAGTGNSMITSAPGGCPSQNWIYYACIMRMSLSVDPSNGNLFALWSEGSHNDVSAAGFANHDLYAAASRDNGASWFDKVNITDSYSNGCGPPDCDHDLWSSMAETVDGVLHIMYVDDNDAGAAWNDQGVWTINNVLYLEVEPGELIPLAIEDGDLDLPFDFALGQNYPNPFNANTVISIDGEIHSGELAIYDVAGRMVRSFPLSQETRSITWDGTDSSGETVASGTYFYSVNFDEFGTAAVRKMTLLK